MSTHPTHDLGNQWMFVPVSPESVEVEVHHFALALRFFSATSKRS
jgi:hypothetical protein